MEPQEKGFHCKRAARRAVMLADCTAIARRSRVAVAIRFASAPIIRCCSAHLVEVRSNHRLPEHSSMRRAQQCRYFARSLPPMRTSLAPHDSKARLISVTTCRRFMAKPCTPHLIAQRVQPFKLQPRNGGVKGQSPLRSLGGPRGPFSHVREWPPYPCSAIGAASPSRAVRGKLPHPLDKSKKCNFF